MQGHFSFQKNQGTAALEMEEETDEKKEEKKALSEAESQILALTFLQE